MILYNRKWFTLVELIVVITVLAVLATVAFTTVGNITSSARNSARLTDVSTLVNKLEMQMSFGKILPKPENDVDLIASGSVVGFQGEFGVNSARTIDLNEIKDPLDKTYYTYTTDSKFGSYQVLAFNEVTTSFLSTQTAFAATTKKLFTKGDVLGILLDSATNIPLEKTWPNTSVDIVNTSSGLTAQFSDTKTLSGTGVAFGWSMWNLLIKQSSFEAPKTCPQGFVPVPGSAEFLQPGFCVMKYEAKALGGNIWPSAIGVTTHTHDYQTSDVIVSTPNDTPIATITQLQAITACAKLGDGYHLISNNEWMTLARNIEAQGINWSSGVMGNGYLYSGHNDNSPVGALLASANDTQGYFAENNAGGSQKRTLVLSNKQIVWDLAGNTWEHVNKSNTLNGTGYTDNNLWKANACWGEWYYSFYNNDGQAPCIYQNNYTYSTLGPSTPNLNAANGIGRIYSSNSTSNNIFIRGGDWSNDAHRWLFAIELNLIFSDAASSVGFRCAKY